MKTANNLIHFDLPSDFDTFCRRYSVLRSNISLEVIFLYSTFASICLIFLLSTETVHNHSRTTFNYFRHFAQWAEPANTVAIHHSIPWIWLYYDTAKKQRASFCEFKSLSIIHLFQKKNKPCFERKFFYFSFVQEKLRRMNSAAPLCMDIATTYTNVGHLLDCKYRHCFENSVKCGESVFAEPKTCQIQILEVLSPVCVSVRLIKSKGTETNDWQQHFIPDSFEQFNEEFTKFYASNFAVVDATEINDNKLYVLRDGIDYYRCRIFTKRWVEHTIFSCIHLVLSSSEVHHTFCFWSYCNSIRRLKFILCKRAYLLSSLKGNFQCALHST